MQGDVCAGPAQLVGETFEPFGRRGAVPASRGNLSGAVRMTEAQAIRAAIERAGYNRLAAARALGLHKSTLFRKMKELGIVMPVRRGHAHPKSTAMA